MTVHDWSRTRDNDPREALIAFAAERTQVAVYSTKNGRACVTCGKIRSVTERMIVVSWDTNETVVPLDAIDRIVAAKAERGPVPT